MVRMVAVSLPVDCASVWASDGEKAAERLFTKVQEKLEAVGARVLRFDIPKIPKGLVDEVQRLRDNIQQGDDAVQMVSKVLRDVVNDLRPASTDLVKMADFQVESYWFDVNEFPVKTWPEIHAIPAGMHQSVNDVFVEYNEKKAAYRNVTRMLQATRKSMESALTGDVALLVPSSSVITTPNLATTMVAVPLDKQDDWLNSYERMAPFVVPRSTELHFTDRTHSLYSVNLFQRSVEDFERVATEKGFTIRPFSLTTEEHELRKQQFRDLVKEEAEMEKDMNDWCEDKLHKVERLKMHLISLRVYADSRERYGLNVPFKAFVVSMPPRAVDRVRAELIQLSGMPTSHVLTPDQERMWISMGFDDGTDNVPYISIQFDM